jgi:N-acetyl-gamma-glutamyl-phosphate reductase
VFRVFIDGQAGTTGLEIAARLAPRSDIELLEIGAQLRKDLGRRAELLNSADLVVLCLPDDAAREAVALIENPRVKVLDASTAHRVAEGWTYGLPELTGEQRDAIRSAQRVSNPGCYPTGFVLSVRPLIEAGVLDAGLPLRVHAVSGYSGGGRAMIERYQAQPDGGERLRAPRAYGLSLAHKHVAEMQRYAGTVSRPLFAPMVGDYYKGMLVHVALFLRELRGIGSAADVHALLAERYAHEPCVDVLELNAPEALEEGAYLAPTAANDTNRIDVMVFGNDEHVLLVTRYDNLGKGASGAAVQNLNLMLGTDELTGLKV